MMRSTILLRTIIWAAALFLATSPLFPSPADAGFVDHFARRDDVGPAKAPHRGHSHILVIPVQLDARRLPPPDLPRIRRFFVDSNPDSRARDERLSFPGFWRLNSGGRFVVTADVVPPVVFRRCPLPVSSDTCTPTRRDFTALAYGIPLVQEVMRRAVAENDLDFADYDRNGPAGRPDGWCDGVVIVMNGGWFGVALPFGIFDARFTLEFDGVKVNMAALSSGRRALPMAIHEYGHLLGFADLYDEWRVTEGLPYSAMGSWKYDARAVPLLDAFSRMQIGWLDVEAISGTQTRLIPPTARGKAFKLGSGREYFLVENRQPIGPYDRQIGAPGLSVLHVNLDRLPTAGEHGFIRTVLDCPNCRRWRPFLMQVQADRRFDLQYRLKREDPADFFRSGDALLPAPRGLRLSPSHVTFSSNAYSGRPTGVAIEEVDSDGLLPFIRATLSAPQLDDPCRESVCTTGRVCRNGRCVEDLDPAFDPPPRVVAMGEPLPDNFAQAAYARGEDEDGWGLPELDWRLLSVLLLVGWLLLRRRIKRGYEKHLRKKGQLAEDEETRSRF